VHASNEEIAALLERVAERLEAQGANPYRARAYRNAAATARTSPRPLVEILEAGGIAALDALPGIGPTIASHVAEIARRGGLTLIERLEGALDPEALLGTVPGIGPALARRLHLELGVESLEELEVAAHDGRLEALPGFGPRRVRAVRESLASILGRSSKLRARRQRWLEAGRDEAARRAAPHPSVEALLDVDAEYRARASRGELPMIAPRRFNPKKRAWLPVLHAHREGWHLTALYSNTARAHALGRTQDWVVIFYERNGDEDQCTVVTERGGPQAGRRVVRGREAECAALQQRAALASRGADGSDAAPQGRSTAPAHAE
jgi:DNA polymerase (family 10)